MFLIFKQLDLFVPKRLNRFIFFLQITVFSIGCHQRYRKLLIAFCEFLATHFQIFLKLRNILDIFISERFSISFRSLLPYLHRIICVALGVIYVNSGKALYRQFLWLFLGSVIDKIMCFPVVLYNRCCVSLNQDLFPLMQRVS